MTGLREQFDAELARAATPNDVAELRAKYVGKNGALTKQGRGADFATLPPEEKKKIGREFNELKTHIEGSLDRLSAALKAKAASRPDFDITLPATGGGLGSVHPIISVQIEIEDIFRSMGFQVYAGDEVVSEFENFDALNIPSDHPARDMQDTFWLENGMVMRTHTSSMQNRAMRELGVPLRAIFPGRCFRNEATDSTHENTFYQLEGMMIDTDITVAHLIAVMKELLSRIFKRDAEVRLRPGFFPFVEPGFELDYLANFGGNPRWIELMPCGMIHPVVLRNGGIDPDQYSGFAFGLGLTRLAMLKFNVSDIRYFNKGDIRFFEQFPATL